MLSETPDCANRYKYMIADSASDSRNSKAFFSVSHVNLNSFSTIFFLPVHFFNMTNVLK